MSGKRGVSCLCTTYGRVGPLADAVGCFLAQVVDVPVELIVLNDFERQFIAIDAPGVVVVNSEERFPNLSAKRNHIMRHCSYDTIVTWGDDDIYLPWYVQSNLDTLREQEESDQGRLSYVCLGTSFFVTGDEQRGLTAVYKKYGPAGPFMMRAAAFAEVGGFTEGENVGEDQTLRKKVANAKGSIVKNMHRPSFGYRWDNGYYHISGLGFDKPGKERSWDVIGRSVNRRADAGEIPTGVIDVQPTDPGKWLDLCSGAYWQATGQPLVSAERA